MPQGEIVGGFGGPGRAGHLGDEGVRRILCAEDVGRESLQSAPERLGARNPRRG